MTGIVDFRTVLEDPDGNNITPNNPLPVSIDGVNITSSTPIPVEVDGFNITTTDPLPVTPQNIQTTFRESFETYNTSTVWNQSVASGDIVQLDGNSVAASYLVISKDPLTADTETYVETRATFPVPLEAIVGISMSQRVLGQECSIEYVDTDTPIPLPADIAIASIQQTTTTLTVTTATPHNLKAGMRIGIRGITADSRLNYPCLVVANTGTSTIFTATAGPMGTISSVTSGPHTSQGFVYVRSALGGAQDGYSQIFENATATNSSMYVRSDSGDAYPSGTFGGNHSVTIGSTASTAPVIAAFNYAFVPTNEYRSLLQADRIQYYDIAIDSTGQPTARRNVTQVVPNPNKTYKLRFRVTNDKALTVPNAKIVSASKAGTTTATITTATAHGLTTGDVVSIFGIRNSTDFPAITSQTTVVSTPTPTTFTVVIGTTTPTTTSYGGFVARVNGANNPAGFNTATSGSLQTVTVTSSLVVLTASANFTVSVGDYVNLYGCRDNTTGADLNVDGVYKVVDISLTNLQLEPIGTTVLPAPFASTNCGGSVIKRTDVRISYVRLFEYLREKVEVLNKGDAFSGVPIVINGGTATGVTTVSTVSTASLAANLIVNDIASANLTLTATTAAITPASSALSQEFNVIVTAVAGTNPTLDVVVQESDDSGTNWYDTYHFPRITATGQYRSPLIPLTGNRIRYVRTLGGTGSPGITNSVNRLQSHTSNPMQRQFFSRVDLNTINNVTATFFTEGCVDLNVVVSMLTITTTSPVLVYEASADGTNWTQVGADITTTANTTTILQLENVQARFSRLRVKTAGSGATVNFLMIKGVGN